MRYQPLARKPQLKPDVYPGVHLQCLELLAPVSPTIPNLKALAFRLFFAAISSDSALERRKSSLARDERVHPQNILFSTTSSLISNDQRVHVGPSPYYRMLHSTGTVPT